MNWLRKRRWRAVLAATAGMVIVLSVSGTGETGKTVSVPVQYTAWWGTLYPKFCFAQKPDEAKNEKDEAGKIPGESGSGQSTMKIKKTFWIKRFF